MPDLAPHDHDLVACHECDLLQRLPPEPPRGCVRCARCSAVLHRVGRSIIDAPLALALAGVVLFVLSTLYPLIEVRLQGSSDTTYLLAGIAALYQQGMPILATLVLITTVLAPVGHLVLLIYVHGALRLGRRPSGLPAALRLIQAVMPWSMLEIFLLGVIVASVKLAEQASIKPGIAAWSLGLLVLVLAAAATQVHPRRLWERIR
jgi:paraquat-inducible protein A